MSDHFDPELVKVQTDKLKTWMIKNNKMNEFQQDRGRTYDDYVDEYSYLDIAYGLALDYGHPNPGSFSVE